MANTLTQYILQGNSFSLTNFLTGAVSLSGINIDRVSFRFSSLLFENQRENGSTVIDSRKISPSVIEVSLFCSTVDAAEVINNILKDISSIYSITSRGLTVDNLVLQDTGISQTAEVLSANPIRLTFKQRLLQDNNSPSCENTGDASVVDQGISILSTAATDAETFAENLYSSILS